MTARRIFIVALAVLIAFPAEAGRRRGAHRAPSYHRAPAVRVHVGPWSAGYAAMARPGWVWVDGHYAGSRWNPGHYRPAVTRPGWLWVAGYWAGSVYVDGYWREEARNSQVWVDGYYDQNDSWVPGYWAPANSVDAQNDRAGIGPDSADYPDQNPAADQPRVPDAPPPEPPASSSGAVYHDYD